MHAPRRREVAALAAQQHGVLARRQLVDAGVSSSAIAHLVRSAQLERVHHGVYRVAGAPPSWRQSVMAACLAGDGIVASHRAAARLFDLRGIDRAPVEVTARRRSAVEAVNVVAHITDTLGPADVTVVDNIPTTSVARTLVGLGAVQPWSVGGALNDAVLRRLVTYDWMWRTVRRLSASGRNGVGVLRVELERRDPSNAPTESALEDAFVRLCRAAGIELRRQARVGPYRVDFADPVRKVIVELDGRRWHESEADRVRDRRRELQLRAAGWRVIRVTWLDLKYWPELVVGELRAALALPRQVGA